MKNTEAIRAIKSNKPTSGYTILCEALDMAIDALEKQIPKKPKKIREDYINGRWEIEYECPSCGNPYADDSFCSCCGQALDWTSNQTEKGGE